MSFAQRGIQRFRQYFRVESSDSSDSPVIIEVILIDRRSHRVELENGKTIAVKDLIRQVCQEEEILPISTELFGISTDENGKNWLSHVRILDGSFPNSKRKLYFRIQFKAMECLRLKEKDKKAFQYYLLQCRHDFRVGKYDGMLNLLESANKQDKKQEMLLRMVILEMLLVGREKNMPLIEVSKKRPEFQEWVKVLGKGSGLREVPSSTPVRESQTKLFDLDSILGMYIKERDEVSKCKKIISKSLQMFGGVKYPGIDFVREIEFLPNYKKERFQAKKVYRHRDGYTLADDIEIVVDPEDGIIWKVGVEHKFKATDHKVAFKDLSSLKIQKEELDPSSPSVKILISKTEGVPEVISTHTEEEAETICCWVDGYYRLTVNQYESLLEGGTGTRLSSFIHGPLDRSVAEHILGTDSSDGVFLLREHGQRYGTFVLSCSVSGVFKHYEVHHQLEEGTVYYYIGPNIKFRSLQDLVAHYQQHKDGLASTLKQNITPSRTDAVPFLSDRKVFPPPLPKSARPIGLLYISQKNLKEISTLPEGRFGKVTLCKGVYGQEGLIVAKKFSSEDISDEGFQELINSCYSKLHHNNIVRLIGFPLKEKPNLLAMEYLEQGPLDKYLKKNDTTITFRTLLKFILQIAEGMMFLQRTMKLVHGGLRTRNILVYDSNQIKISDPCLDYILQEEGKLTPDKLEFSCNWLAPEVLQGKRMTSKSDVWSFSMTVFEMMTLEKPYGAITKDQLLQDILEEKRPDLNALPYFPNALHEIVKDCWKTNPEERSDFGGIYNQFESFKSSKETPSAFWNRAYYRWRQIEAQELEERKRTEEARKEAMKQEKAKIKQEYGALSGSTTSMDSYYGVDSCSRDSISRSISLDDIALKRKRSATSLNSIDRSSDEIDSPRHLNDSKETIELMEFRRDDKTDKVVVVDKQILDKKENVETQNESLNSTESDLGQEPASPVDEPMEAPTEDANPNSMTVEELELAGVLASMANTHKTGDGGKDKPQVKVSPMMKNYRRTPRKVAKLARETDMSDNIPSPPALTPDAELSEMQRRRSLSQYQMHVNREGFQSFCRGLTAMSSADPYMSVSTATGLLGLPRDVSNCQSPGTTDSRPSSHGSNISFSSESRDRKRSFSVTEDTRKESKKAAKRALCGQNPFNLVTSLPKNFLVRTERHHMSLHHPQTPEISRFFNTITPKSPKFGRETLPSQETLSMAQKTGANPDIVDRHLFSRSESINESRTNFSLPQPDRNQSDVMFIQEKISSMSAHSPRPSPPPAKPTAYTQLPPVAGFMSAEQSPKGVPSSTPTSQLTTILNQIGATVSGNNVVIPKAPQFYSAMAQSIPRIAQVMSIQGQIQQQQQQQQQQQPTRNVQVPPQAPAVSKREQEPPGAPAKETAETTQVTITQLQNFFTQVLAARIQASAVPPQQVLSPQPGQSTQTGIALFPRIPVTVSFQAPSLLQNQNFPQGMGNTKRKKSPSKKAAEPTVSNVSTQPLEQSNFTVPQGQSAIPQAYLQTLLTPRLSVPPLYLSSNSLVTTPVLRGSVPSDGSMNAMYVPPKTQPPSMEDVKPVVTIDQEDPYKKETDVRFAVKKEPTSPVGQPMLAPGFPRVVVSKLPDSHLTRPPLSSPGISRQQIEEFSSKLSYIQVKRRSGEFSPPAPGMMTSKDILADLEKLRFIDKKDLDFREKLGEGQFGEVQKAFFHFKDNDGTKKHIPAAVKLLKPDSDNSLQTLQEFKTEAKNMAKLEHEYIVRLYGVCVDVTGPTEELMLVTELMPLGSLTGYVRKNKRTLSIGSLLNYAVQIAKGMEYLHCENIVHRDLATRNVLVFSRSKVKICDFGLSRMFQENKDYYRQQGRKLLPIRWYALESITKGFFDAKSDVWSYGVTLWEMFMLWDEDQKDHVKPYDGLNEQEIIEYLEKGERLSKPKKCPDKIWTIIKNTCWAEDPSNRKSCYLLYLAIEDYMLDAKIEL